MMNKTKKIKASKFGTGNERNEKPKLAMNQKEERIFGKDLKNINKIQTKNEYGKNLKNVKTHIVIDQEKNLYNQVKNIISTNNQSLNNSFNTSFTENSMYLNNSKINHSNFNFEKVPQNLKEKEKEKQKKIKINMNKLPENIGLKNLNHSKSLFEIYKKDELKQTNTRNKSKNSNKSNLSNNKQEKENKLRSNNNISNNTIHKSYLKINNNRSRSTSKVHGGKSEIKRVSNNNTLNPNLQEKTNPKLRHNTSTNEKKTNNKTENSKLDSSCIVNKYSLTEMDREFNKDIYYVTDYVLDIFQHLLETQVSFNSLFPFTKIRVFSSRIVIT